MPKMKTVLQTKFNDLLITKIKLKFEPCEDCAVGVKE